MRAIRQLVATLAVVLALAPFAAIIATALIAAALGCQLNEAAPGPCEFYGTDFGGLLSGLLVTGGLVQFTIPFLMALLAVWAIVEGVMWLWHRSRAPAIDPGEPV